LAEIRRVPASPDDARARIREAVSAILDDPYTEHVDVPQIIADVVREIDGDPEWRRALLTENVAPLVRSITSNMMAADRTLGLTAPILLGVEKLTPVDVDRFVERRGPKFELWFEQANGNHIHLLDMRKSDLREARRKRIQQGVRHLHVARIEEILEQGLDDDTQTVGQKYTVDDIARIAATEALPVLNNSELGQLFANLDGPVLSLPEVKNHGRSRHTT